MRDTESTVRRGYTSCSPSHTKKKKRIMPLGKSTRKVGNFLHKTVRSIKSICYRDYWTLPNAPLPSPFSHRKDSQANEIYSIPVDEQKSECQNANKNNAMFPVEALMAQQASQGSAHQQEKEQKARCRHKQESHFCNVGNKGGSYALERRMKDLDMMGLKDVDHVSDVKEAICCYSMIRSPVYIDIVDNFFMDMYTEFSRPLKSTPSSIKGSRRRAGSFRL